MNVDALRVAAPGKVLLSGAYAVLEGATAVVIAVDRYALADPLRRGPASREVRAALGDDAAPAVDTSALYDGTAKLGLGSSAAVLVASIGARLAASGADLARSATRASIAQTARRAHAEAQSGGSGVDVAASVWGGILAYSMARGEGAVRALAIPPGLHIDAVWSGTSARTTELRARVATLDRATHAARMRELGDASAAAVAAFGGRDIAGILRAGQATRIALTALGRDARAAIVPPAFAELAELAEAEGAAFYPSGAGGGDVGIYLGTRPPSTDLLRRYTALGMRPLSIAIDTKGIHRTM
ncbi:hypothetical protein LZC95_34220 [Pendulispora brunnea]|uniref:phosphomevalonate kinase n=1 Tax=Pendulispora brunnea TaxID=2905690 RepID=A0ABZ2JYF5_9BACT